MLLLSSCGGKEETSAQNEAAKSEAAQPAAEGAAPATTAPQTKYKIKSGIVTNEMDNPVGQGKITTVLYFDDYGAKEASVTKTEMKMMGMAVKTHNVEITRDGYQYKLDMEKKTGTKFKMPATTGGIASFANMSAADMGSEMAKEYNIRKEASQTVAGKECEVYSMDNQKRQMKGTFATYQGIPMKVDQMMGGMKITSEVVKFEENAAMPAGIFDVPADVKIEEVKY
jgi:hypothetical protein